jgi:septum formation protein
MPNIILASASPRRKEILEKIGLKFRVVPSNFNETLSSNVFSQSEIENLAYRKGLDVAKRFENDIVISADTVVVLNNEIYTKPKSKEHAFNMLNSLSGKTHFVLTSVCLIYQKSFQIVSTKTLVTFSNLSSENIEYYIENFSPYDKAGSYGIQELPQGFVKSIDGDLENVIGLSSKVVLEMLQNVNT